MFGTLVRMGKHDVTVIELGSLMTDIPIYVSCKVERYIFKTVLVINENARFAFLYVLSVYCSVIDCLTA